MTHDSLIARVAAAATLVAVAILGACGGATDDETLDPVVIAGREAAARLGCAACHGSDGKGVEDLGPTWVGLIGSTVQLQDGSTIVADRTYVERSIREPDAQRVTGFTLPMPEYRLEDRDMAALLDYIEVIE